MHIFFFLYTYLSIFVFSSPLYIYIIITSSNIFPIHIYIQMYTYILTAYDNNFTDDIDDCCFSCLLVQSVHLHHRENV